MQTITPEYLRPRLLHRRYDSHKGDYGHLLVVAGCETMPGAAVLATGAALKSGCGLVTLHSTPRALQAAANNFPSAILSEDREKYLSTPPEDFGKYSAVAAGPGLGIKENPGLRFSEVLRRARNEAIPMVLDADAITWLSQIPERWSLIPEGSVLTPHLGELRRLLGEDNEGALESKVKEFCKQTRSVLVWKGYHTRVFTPDGECRQNTSGGPGLAKGGSGDVLTGLIGGLLARGYSPEDAAALGVWIHGYAADMLTANKTAEAFNSRDLIDSLYCGFYKLYNE